MLLVSPKRAKGVRLHACAAEQPDTEDGSIGWLHCQSFGPLLIWSVRCSKLKTTARDELYAA